MTAGVSAHPQGWTCETWINTILLYVGHVQFGFKANLAANGQNTLNLHFFCGQFCSAQQAGKHNTNNCLLLIQRHKHSVELSF